MNSPHRPSPHPLSNENRIRRRACALALGLAGALLLAGCGRAPVAGPAAGGPPGGPPVVGVVTLTPSAVALTRELPGRTSAFRVAQVRARVDGIVLKRLFTEGSEVKEGQALYQIDPAPYQATLDNARATLARAEANASSARTQERRYKELLEASAVSQQDYDTALAAAQSAEADIAAGRAAVRTASINLGYTAIVSPVSGRIGRSSVTEGAYVQQAQATLLATVQQLDPIYVDLTQSSGDLLKLKEDLASGRLQSAGKDRTPVTLLLDGERDYGAPGTLQFSDVTVDPGTNSVTLRALFPNPEGNLLPGMFVRARLAEGVTPAALLVPQIGVSRDQRGAGTALVVNAENKVEPRPVTTGRAVDNQWLVIAGLAAGDRVIVQGMQMLRPGTEVKVVPASASKPADPARPGAPAKNVVAQAAP